MEHRHLALGAGLSFTAAFSLKQAPQWGLENLHRISPSFHVDVLLPKVQIAAAGVRVSDNLFPATPAAAALHPKQTTQSTLGCIASTRLDSPRLKRGLVLWKTL
ncbi:hypothetical protein CLCR_01001 [Cladophialophora carrionii]|uniref:Uncharacterized protein n=1 Tax=Cladophialophora carrionii TaxID=86049 RepID=A0A1C1D0Y2_9EURO|nr:hypothetical protein CLCR_01001 [Cladophialophora carrionii]